jgi:hypothetical protein
MLAVDFFTVGTILLQRLYRKPSGAWVTHLTRQLA